ncbi:glycosyltransferase [Alteromonas sp. 345S023]|uniref:Glycosyltransferase n=1 Tax=Alteromonas profundi TaxID=2696062 RepID=A0A7X5LNG4_9ALTE|nr:glycosyltransferase [Alteromonas profundi]NDV92563.1 glycosyltransferase [Alteromonas profundi]
MKILMVTSPIVSLREPFKGGTESFVVSLANGMASAGHEVDILCKDADEDNQFNTLQLQESAFRMADAITEESDGQKLFQAAQFGLFDTEDYDIIHFHSYYHAMYDFAFFHQRANVITLHSPVSERLALTHKLNSSRSKDIYVAVSQRLAEQWRETISSELAIIPNGIDMAHLPSPATKKNDEIIWVGRLCEEKNPVKAIHAAQALNVALTLYGPISDKPYFDECVSPLLKGDIRYGGHVSQHTLYSYISHARLLLITSDWKEPFGLVTLEALALGTPVIGTDAAIPKELRHSPVTQTIDVADRDSLHHAYKTACDVSVTECQGVASMFDISFTVKAYERIYAAAKA